MAGQVSKEGAWWRQEVRSKAGSAPGLEGCRLAMNEDPCGEWVEFPRMWVANHQGAPGDLPLFNYCMGFIAGPPPKGAQGGLQHLKQ